MNRLEFLEARLTADESFVAKEKGVKLYDGDEKSGYEDGEVVLTSHRMFWGRSGEIAKGMTCMSLSLSRVDSLYEEWASANLFGRKKRLIIRLLPISAGDKKLPGPRDGSTQSFIKLSTKSGITDEFISSFRETVNAQVWNVNTGEDSQAPPKIQLRSGIVGIERKMQERQKFTEESVSIAFQDLSKLMAMAQEMSNVSKSISKKIKDHQGEISADDTVKFKSYLLSLGIDDPVMKDNYSSASDYYDSLAKQLTEFLLDALTENGGMISLADVYCRVNRARGMELLSPEDLLNACHRMRGPIRLRTFPSGAMVLQTDSHDNEMITRQICEELKTRTSVSMEELAQHFNISLVLSMERLLTAERSGEICRDESVEGVRFYLNLFLTQKNAQE